MVHDTREQIENIQWTVAGKVKEVQRTGASTRKELTFGYGADGQRIMKQVGQPGSGGFKDYYIRDAQGNIMATYRYSNNFIASLKVTDRPIYGSKRLGSYTRPMELVGEEIPTTFVNYTQPMNTRLLHYELNDHLGNVTAVVTGRLLPAFGPGIQYQAELLTASGYEPFGSLLPGRNYSSDSYRFGFNGKEKDDEWHGAAGTLLDYGERAYDTRVARFFRVDPLSSKYPHYSPYQYAGNKPIRFVDVDGLEEGFDIRMRQMETGYLKGKVTESDLLEFYRSQALGAALGLGVLATRGAILRYGPQLLLWATQNPISAQEVAVTIFSVATGYDGPSPNVGGDFAMLGRKSYSALAKKGVTDADELGKIGRNAYKAIVATIDEEIINQPSWKEKAMKAFDIRGKAKDFAREISGPINKSKAEAESMERYGSKSGPSFGDLVKKYMNGGSSEEDAYKSIVESSKRTNASRNAQHKAE